MSPRVSVLRIIGEPQGNSERKVPSPLLSKQFESFSARGGRGRRGGEKMPRPAAVGGLSAKAHILRGRISTRRPSEIRVIPHKFFSSFFPGFGTWVALSN